MGKKNFIKCHFQQKSLDVMFASWAYEVTGFLTQRSTEEASSV